MQEAKLKQETKQKNLLIKKKQHDVKLLPRSLLLERRFEDVCYETMILSDFYHIKLYPKCINRDCISIPFFYSLRRKTMNKHPT